MHAPYISQRTKASFQQLKLTESQENQQKNAEDVLQEK